ncbi:MULTISPECIES: hypothetical protein [Kribbella]|uniref:hypothetical protein n=1 Tax=Kribbella TaxID=182639 RepID=UPI0013051328|nr:MULTISPECIES: hypothetical protein [Kribbella]
MRQDAHRVTGDTRSFLVRTFRGSEGRRLGRTLLSDKFTLIDNLDALDGHRYP